MRQQACSHAARDTAGGLAAGEAAFPEIVTDKDENQSIPLVFAMHFHGINHRNAAVSSAIAARAGEFTHIHAFGFQLSEAFRERRAVFPVVMDLFIVEWRGVGVVTGHGWIGEQEQSENEYAFHNKFLS